MLIERRSFKWNGPSSCYYEEIYHAKPFDQATQQKQQDTELELVTKFYQCGKNKLIFQNKKCVVEKQEEEYNFPRVFKETFQQDVKYRGVEGIPWAPEIKDRNAKYYRFDSDEGKYRIYFKKVDQNLKFIGGMISEEPWQVLDFGQGIEEAP